MHLHRVTVTIDKHTEGEYHEERPPKIPALQPFHSLLGWAQDHTELIGHKL